MKCHFRPKEKFSPKSLLKIYQVKRLNLQYWWFPKGTDPKIISYFSGVLKKAMETEYVRGRLAELSILPHVIVGEELKDRIQDRMEKFSEMSIIERVKLPNVVAWTLGAILLFGVGVIRNQLRSNSTSDSENDPTVLRFDLVWKSLLVLFLYVLVMAMAWVSFVWATILFVVFACLVLVGLKKENLLVVAELALLMSFGVHLIFTQVFMVTLP